MKTIKLTMGQALMKFLDNQYIELDGVEYKYVQGVATLFGHGVVCGFGEALYHKQSEMPIYMGKNEQGMAHMAMAFAKQNNRKAIIPCTSSIGPGALNMVPAAGTATANRIPLLLLPGDTYACRQPDPVLQQIEQSDSVSITANDAFKAVCKYWDRVNRPDQLMAAMTNAMRVLTDMAETGAVCVALPQDVEAESFDYPCSFFDKKIHHIKRIAPDKAELDAAVSMIKSAKKPIIICGGGVMYSEAAIELQKFVEATGIPFGETQAGKGAILSAHPLNLGGIGATGGIAANIYAKDADLIISIGTRLSDFTTSSKWLFQNENAKFLNININKMDSYKLGGTMMVADAKAALQALMTIDYKCEQDVTKLKAQWDAEIDKQYSDIRDNGLSQTHVLGEFNRLIDKSAVVVGSSGSLPGCMQRLWRSQSYRSYHMEYAFSCMGYEVCGALGAKIAAPEREVYSMVGDGSFVMLHSELLTAIQEGIKINVVLFDNSGFGCIENLQNSVGIPTFNTVFRYRDKNTNKLEGDNIPIDFAKIAEGYGAKAYRITTIEELHAAIEDSKKQTVCTLFDIKVLHKSMSPGYESWWRVGIPAISDLDTVNAAHEEQKKELEIVRI